MNANHFRFFLYAALAFTIGEWLSYQHGGQTWYAIMTLPGTFFHELAHFMTALLLGGSPHGFTVWPTWNDSGQMETLGHVIFQINWYNGAPVGLSPFLLMPFTAWILALAARSMHPIKVFLLCWVAACSWESSTPSAPDFSIAMSEIGSWPLAGVMLIGTSFAIYKIIRLTLSKP